MAKRKEDRLEKFIIDHRSEFDYIDPPEGLWDKISEEVGKDKHGKVRKLNSFGWVWKVAAIIFFALTVYMAAEKFIQPDQQSEIAVRMNENGFHEFNNAEKYYTDVIQVKRKELDKILTDNKDLNADFSKDIAELDSMYTLLKEDFEVNNDELVMDAMIYNLRLRIEILDRQLQIIKNLNTLEKTKNEGRNI